MTALLPETGPDAAFQAHVADGRLWLQHCRDCGDALFYPRVLCPHCASRDLEWRPASGRGRVYSKAVLRVRVKPGDPRPPFHALVLVDLPEGPRLMSRLPGVAPDDIHIGMAVTARIEGEDGEHVVVFEPSEEAAR